jgi:hypothetical protein
MKIEHALVAALGCTSLAACATTPGVVVNYYETKSETQVSVTETIQCARDGVTIVSTATASVSPTYSADTSKAPLRFNLSDVADWYADNDLKFTFTKDGRLAGVNSTATGHGEDIAKAVAGLIPVASGIGLFGLKAEDLQEKFAELGIGPKGAKKPPTACDVIKAIGDGKPISLTYSLEQPINVAAHFDEALWLKGDQPTQAIESSIAAAGAQLPRYSVRFSRPVNPLVPAAYTKGPHEIMPMLKVNATVAATAEIDVHEHPAGKPETATNLHAETVIVPLASYVELPVPRSAVFGAQTFALTLDDSGAITSVQYVKNTGIGSSINAGADLGPAIQPTSASQKADALKAQADLIVQQQRLTKCRADPTTCS